MPIAETIGVVWLPTRCPRRLARAMKCNKIPKQSGSVLDCKFGVRETRALMPSATQLQPAHARRRNFRDDQACRPGVDNFKLIFAFASDRRLMTTRSEGAAQDSRDRRFVINDPNSLRSAHPPNACQSLVLLQKFIEYTRCSNNNRFVTTTECGPNIFCNRTTSTCVVTGTRPSRT
jgi:hypothetical protein